MAVASSSAPVARLHLRSTVEGVDHQAIEAFCLSGHAEQWAGVGWGLWDESSSGIDWQGYRERKADAGEGVDDSVQRLHDLPVGALLWTRRRDSSYWLGEIAGDWEYHDGPEPQRLDMFNLRPCRWHHVGTEDAVPGKVVNNFRARRTLNPVADSGAVRYTRRLHAQLTGSAAELEPVDPREVINSLLGPTDLEDLVAVYLQDRHDLVLVSRGRSTPGYEYVLRHRRTGRRAVASVKSGGSRIAIDRLPADPKVDVWAYEVSAGPAGTDGTHVRWIGTEDLADFMLERRDILPDQVARWLS